jgi:hypothetical protein
MRNLKRKTRLDEGEEGAIRGSEQRYVLQR